MTKKLVEEYRVVKEGRWVTTVQQKCLVCDDSKMYSPPNYGPPERDGDIFAHADSVGRPWWIPTEVKWVDLPSVTVEEARKDTTTYE